MRKTILMGGPEDGREIDATDHVVHFPHWMNKEVHSASYDGATGKYLGLDYHMEVDDDA